MEFEVDGTGKKFIDNPEMSTDGLPHQTYRLVDGKLYLVDPGSPPLPREELLEQIARLEREVNKLRMEKSESGSFSVSYQHPDSQVVSEYTSSQTFPHFNDAESFNWPKLGNQVVAE
jgi:hypothetical protein